MVERANQEVMKHLRMLVNEFQGKEQCTQYLPLVQRIVNASPHSATGVAPTRLLFGDMITPNRGVLAPFPSDDADDEVDLGVEHEAMTRTEDVLRKRKYLSSAEYIRILGIMQKRLIARSQKFQQKVVDQRLAENPAEPTMYDAGDYVLVSYPVRAPSKLTAKWKGPMIVVDRKHNIYSVQDLCSLQVQQVDVSRMKSFRGELTRMEMQALAARDGDEYVVAEIIDHVWTGDKVGNFPNRKPLKSELDFKVRWLGYGPERDSWIPYMEAHKLEALDAYLTAHPEVAKLLGG